MSKYRQKFIVVDAIRLEYRMLMQRPEGAMSAEPGDYLETIRIGECVYQRIVPAKVFEATHNSEGGKHKGGKKVTGVCNEQQAFGSFTEEEERIRVDRINQILETAMTMPEVYASLGEPHDGYPLTRD